MLTKGMFIWWKKKLLVKKTVFYFNIFENVICSFNGKAEFSASVLQSSVSHDPSEIILLFSFAAK